VRILLRFIFVRESCNDSLIFLEKRIRLGLGFESERFKLLRIHIDSFQRGKMRFQCYLLFWFGDWTVSFDPWLCISTGEPVFASFLLLLDPDPMRFLSLFFSTSALWSCWVCYQWWRTWRLNCRGLGSVMKVQSHLWELMKENSIDLFEIASEKTVRVLCSWAFLMNFVIWSVTEMREKLNVFVWCGADSDSVTLCAFYSLPSVHLTQWTSDTWTWNCLRGLLRTESEKKD